MQTFTQMKVIREVSLAVEEAIFIAFDFGTMHASYQSQYVCVLLATAKWRC